MLATVAGSSTRAPLLCLMLLTACTGETSETGGTDGVANYQVNLRPVVPPNQAGLLQSLDALQLIVEPQAGDPIAYDLEGSTDSGDSAKVSSLPALDEATLALKGRKGSSIIAFGRSAPVTASTGEVDVNVLVSELDKLGLLGGLPEARWLGQAVALGDGRFAVLGGTSNGSTSDDGGLDSIAIFDISEPGSDLAFSTSPDIMAPLNEDMAGRAAFTATRLTASHQHTGKVLIAGGASDFFSLTTGTEALSLWDPETGEVEILDGRYEELGRVMSHHLAVEDAAGHVVFVGGLGEAYTQGSTTYWSFGEYVAVFDPAKSEIIAEYTFGDVGLDGDADPAFNRGAVARLGSDGTLVCGGNPQSNTKTTITAECFLVNINGDIEDVDDLPIPLMDLQMVTLEDGEVVALGGYTAEVGENIETGTFEASPYVFRFNGRDWTDQSDNYKLLNARAAFGAAALPDGRIFVAGGTYQGRDVLWGSSYATACAEIFDPESGQAVAIDGCTENSDSASLETRTAYPMVAADPDYGVLVAGGIDDSSKPLDQTLLFVPQGIVD